jgi:hypothetical protein
MVFHAAEKFGEWAFATLTLALLLSVGEAYRLA